MMDDDEQRQLAHHYQDDYQGGGHHEMPIQVKSSEPPLQSRPRYHPPYRTGCLGCCSRVPGVSLASWLIVFFGAGGYVGGNLVWTKQTAEFLNSKLYVKPP